MNREFAFLRSVVLAFVATLVLFFICVHSVRAMDEKLFEVVQKFDNLYEKGISTSGRHVTTMPTALPHASTDYEWQYTQSSANRAVFEVSNIVPKFDNDSPVIHHRQVFLFDQKRSGRKLITLSLSVPIQEYANSQDVVHAILDLHASDSEVLSFHLEMFLFAIGRGVSRKIVFGDDANVIESVNFKGVPCVFVSGIGQYMAGRGKWEFYMLKDAAYMLRYAKFLRDGTDMGLEIETFGLNRQNDCFFPERAEVRVLLGGGIDIIHSFAFTSANQGFDTVLFDRVTREFDGELPNGSLKMDNSSGELKSRVIGGAEPHEPFPLPPRRSFWFYFTMAVVNIVGIALLIYLYYRERHKKIKSS
jgi:hypothetical protein